MLSIKVLATGKGSSGPTICIFYIIHTALILKHVKLDDLGRSIKVVHHYISVLYSTYSQLHKLDYSPYNPSEQVVRGASVYILSECFYVSHFFT